MNTILTKLKDFVGINEQEDDDDNDDEDLEWERENQPQPVEPVNSQPQEEIRTRRTREALNLTAETPMGTTTRSNVIGMPGITNGIAEVVVIEPHSFEEMPQVIQTLRERKSVVLNLNVMNAEEAQRAVDFVAGGTYAIDGHQERIGESIFLFTPNCVKVSTLTGTVHDVNDPLKVGRPIGNSPVWAAETNRIAQ